MLRYFSSWRMFAGEEIIVLRGAGLLEDAAKGVVVVAVGRIPGRVGEGARGVQVVAVVVGGDAAAILRDGRVRAVRQ